jgi:hypothetical protein
LLTLKRRRQTDAQTDCLAAKPLIQSPPILGEGYATIL